MFHILLFHQEFKRVCHHLTKEQVADALNKNKLKHKLIGIKWNQWISKIGCFASEYLNRLSTCLYAFPVVNWKFFHAFPDPVNPVAYYSVKTFQIVHWHAPSPQIQERFSQADEEKNVIKSAFIGSVQGWCCFQGIWRLWGLAGMRSKLPFLFTQFDLNDLSIVPLCDQHFYSWTTTSSATWWTAGAGRRRRRRRRRRRSPWRRRLQVEQKRVFSDSGLSDVLRHILSYVYISSNRLCFS